ncbi:MAG: endonuclease [Nitrososphaeraceae archaeon]|jgi:5-methylcytosine-specific restriction endonuclease McrA|nr:endonuclease [Nitrososphaeraceae archaeon]
MGKQKQLMMLEPRRLLNVKSNKRKKKKRYNNNLYGKNDLYFWAREIRMQYNYHCVYCDTTRNLSAHHIFPKSKYKGLKYNLNNGILMCEKCHIQLHELNDPLEGTIHF